MPLLFPSLEKTNITHQHNFIMNNYVGGNLLKSDTVRRGDSVVLVIHFYMMNNLVDSLL